MGQLKFGFSSSDQEPPGLTDLSGFDAFYNLLRALVSVQDMANYHERLRILLLLARWQDDPPDVNTVARFIGTEPEAIAGTLGLLRSSGWLADDRDVRRYSLSAHGRILITFLQFLAQPWAEGDETTVSAELYDTAEKLGLRQDLLAAQFANVLSSLEEHARQMDTALTSESVDIVSKVLQYSRQDMRLAHRALELREKGATLPEAYGQVQRMHGLISHMMNLAGQLETRYKRLLTRDLLAQGAVTLGDIMAWARAASDAELAESLQPHIHVPLKQVWAFPETAILDAGADLAGRPPRAATRTRPPAPVAHDSFQSMPDIDDIKQQLFRAQALLLEHLHLTDPLPLDRWVDQAVWETAVVHFAAALDPELRRASEPVYLTLDAEGKQVKSESAAIVAVTQGELSRVLHHE